MASSEDVEKVTLTMNKATIQEVEEEAEVKKIDRHCAFCLTLVKGEEVKLCSKCKRRTYCSKECQKADWKSPKNSPAYNGKIHGYGQSHKDWCGLPYGEEDLDWKVTPISGKGLGIVALRDLPPLYRIIVEGMQAKPVLGNDGRYTPYHPGMDDLVPLSTNNPSEKFYMNSQGTQTGFLSMVGLRISRTNHSCDANASCADDMEFQVLILSSNREIKKGEEITYAYLRFDDLCIKINEVYDGKSPDHLRHILFTKWGITCPPDCPCRDGEKIKMLKLCHKLYEECERDYKLRNVLTNVEKMIEIAEKIGCCPSTMNKLYYFASGYATTARINSKAKNYLELYLIFNRAIFHPNSKSQVKDWEEMKLTL